MSNYAALIEVLSVAGSRLSDGTANASGTVWFFEPGGNTPVNVYSDAEASAIVTQPIVLNEGGLVSSADYPDGIFATQPVRLLIQDADTATVADLIYIPATAGNVGLNNEGWTGTTEDEAWTALFTSVGGVDGTYKESGGATSRTIHDKFQEQGIYVTDFADVDPTGIGISTTGMQAALNRGKALGVNVIIPAGTYKIDAALTLTSAAGVSIIGAGLGSTTITSTHATANGVTLTTCTDFTVSGINFVHATASTGTALALVACVRATVESCALSDGASYLIGLDASGAGTDLTVVRSFSYGLAADASGRAIRTAYVRNTIADTFVRATGGSAIEFTGAASDGVVTNCYFGSTATSPVGVEFDSTLTGTRFSVYANPTLGIQTTPISVSGVTIWPGLKQWGNGIAGSATSTATGAAVAPSLMIGDEITLTATGGAGIVTVNAPAVLPSGANANGLYYDFVFKNAAGGAVTWTTNAIFVLVGAAAIPATDAHTICVRFRWDPATQELRECYRGDTVT